MDLNNTLYPLNSAGRKMISKVPVAKKNDNVKKVLSTIRKSKTEYDTINYVYIL
jgi:Mg/Co/Ni transporter MgtE